MLRNRHGTESDVDLFGRFLAGDDRAFHDLFRRHNGRLLLYCRKIVGDGAQAEDLTQEMWTKVIELRRRPPEVRNPVGLLLRIARNLCIDHLRKSQRLLSLTDLDDETVPDYTIRQPSEMEEHALAALERLPFEYREVLVLNLYCGYRFDEIASMLDKSSEAVWAVASRARRKLRGMILKAVATDSNKQDQSTAAADREPTIKAMGGSL